jgi:hypothetical protein
VNAVISQPAIHAFDSMPQGHLSGAPLRQPAQAQMSAFQRRHAPRTNRFRLFLMQRTQAILQHSLYNFFRMHGPTPSTFAHREGYSIGSMHAFVISNH